MNIPKVSLPRIVVIGAGFAGLQVAKNINTDRYQVVVIDKNNYHTFQPLLYQVASAGLEPDSIAYPIRKTLRNKKNIFFRLTEVTSIDFDAHLVVTNIGDIKYDHLVIATGALNNFFGIPSIENGALPMKSVVDALNLRSKILGNFEQALNTTDLEKRNELMNFVIVGGGPTGVELAGALAELKNKILPKDFPDLDLRQMRINLIEAAPRLLSAMSEVSSDKAYQALRAMGVEVWLNTFVQDYKDNIVTTKGADTFKADTLIWAAGVKGNIPEGIHNDDIGSNNRIITDGFLKMHGQENIYVLGDAGIIQSEEYTEGLPMVAAVAMQQGKYLAKTLNRLAKGKDIQSFQYNDKGTMATIGRNRAVVELGKLKFQGIFAWFVWMLVHLMLLVGFRNRVVVFINWTVNYFKYNNGLRLIIRPFEKYRDKVKTNQLVEL